MHACVHVVPCCKGSTGVSLLQEAVLGSVRIVLYWPVGADCFLKW